MLRNRDNNAPVETWVHSVKDSIIQKKKRNLNMRVGTLVGFIHRNLKGRLWKHRLVKKTKHTTKVN